MAVDVGKVVPDINIEASVAEVTRATDAQKVSINKTGGTDLLFNMTYEGFQNGLIKYNALDPLVSEAFTYKNESCEIRKIGSCCLLRLYLSITTTSASRDSFNLIQLPTEYSSPVAVALEYVNANGKGVLIQINGNNVSLINMTNEVLNNEWIRCIVPYFIWEQTP